MQPSYNAVLTEFTPVQITKPVAQRFTLEISAYAFARAQCLLQKVDDAAGEQRIRAEVAEQFEKYAVSSDHIKRRQLIFFPRMGEIEFTPEGRLDVQPPEQPHLRPFDIDVDPNGANLETRMQGYGKVVDEALATLYTDDSPAPNDLIHVSCSGYLAPNPIERMVAEREWFGTTVTNSYHMGCYGAFPAWRMGYGFLASAQMGVTPPKTRVDIVHSELLSLHCNILEATPENIITMTLFSDGLIKYSVMSEEKMREGGLRGLRVLALHERLLPNTAGDMTWTPSAHQFLMTLSPMVPVATKMHVEGFTRDLLARAGLDFDTMRDSLLFAIHPGGPKIVEHVQDALSLRDDQVAISRDVFRENGNMSSATVPHILKQTLEDAPLGAKVVAIGFGPGLTATGAVLEKV